MAGIDDLITRTAKLNIEKPDEDYYGLQGLDPNTELYRVCSEEEVTADVIKCKAKPGTPDWDRKVEQHIASGSKKPSRFISTTVSSDVAWKWTEVGQPIIKIYLSRMTGMDELDKMINLTNKEVREHFIKGAIHRNRTKSSQEVLFQERIRKKNPSTKRIVFELWKRKTATK